MATQYYNRKADYNLSIPESEIFISVATGNGQGGSYIVMKENRILGANETVSAGMSDSCTEKTIKVIVTIQDKLAQTNWTNTTITVKQGANSTDYAYKEEVPSDWDTACYIIKIKMTRK